MSTAAALRAVCGTQTRSPGSAATSSRCSCRKPTSSEAAEVAQALVDAVRRNTAVVGGERKSVTTSIGVAMFDATSEMLTGEAVLIEADLAMYDAKEAGRDRYAFSGTSEHRTSRTKARLTWVDRIEHALEHDRFALLAQPILDLQTQQRAPARAAAADARRRTTT